MLDAALIWMGSEGSFPAHVANMDNVPVSSDEQHSVENPVAAGKQTESMCQEDCKMAC